MNINYFSAYRSGTSMIFISCFDFHHTSIVDVLLDHNYSLIAIDKQTFQDHFNLKKKFKAVSDAVIVEFGRNDSVREIESRLK